MGPGNEREPLSWIKEAYQLGVIQVQKRRVEEVFLIHSFSFYVIFFFNISDNFSHSNKISNAGLKKLFVKIANAHEVSYFLLFANVYER